MSRLDTLITDLTSGRLSRRQLTQRTAALGLAVPFASSRGILHASAQGGRNSVVWVSPRGTLEVLDDYAYWTAKEMGYFGDLETELLPAILEATSSSKAVAEGQADMSFVSPGVFSLGIEAGIDLVSVFHEVAQDTFDFALPAGSDITEVAQLEGKTVALGDAGWSSITDPMFAQAGIDPASVRYAVAGTAWPQAVAEGQADAALTWEGLRAQWGAQGLEYDYILGKEWSKFPSNSFQIRREDFEDPALTDLYTSYLRGWAMGLEFGHQNPRAATQITMDAEGISEALNATFADKAIAVESMWQGALIFRGDWANREGWGWHDMASWQLFLDTIKEIGQLTQDISAEDICKNDYIAGVNDFDFEQVKADALAYPLRPEYEAIPVPEGAGA
jgi:NitT/TauT family transport system substrate-binding protein